MLKMNLKKNVFYVKYVSYLFIKNELKLLLLVVIKLL